MNNNTVARMLILTLFIISITTTINANELKDSKKLYQANCIKCHGFKGYGVYSRCNNCHNNYKNSPLTQKIFKKGFIIKLLIMKETGQSPSIKQCPTLNIPSEMYQRISKLDKKQINSLADYIYSKSSTIKINKD